MNNYTTNAEHVDLELACFLDSGLAWMYFEENFISLSEGVYLYTDNGNVPDDSAACVTISKRTNSKNELASALDELQWGGSYVEDVKSYTIAELISELLDEADTDAFTGDSDYLSALDASNVDYTRDYDTITLTGYSQGDYATVIVPTETLTEAWGTTPDLNTLKQSLHNLFYDAPLYFLLTVDGEEHHHHPEFWPDDYKYDKDDFINAFMENYSALPEPEYIREFLNKNMPDYPEYVA